MTIQAPADARPGRLTTPVDAATLERHAPDLHLSCIEHGALRARASVWWKNAPTIPGERVGAIGHYAADSESAGRDVLHRACCVLREARCTLAVGPMDGNTWRSYRFIVDRGVDRPFFLEPDHPEEWPRHFSSAGFATVATYTSAVAENLQHEDARMAGIEERLRADGVALRTLDPVTFETDLRRIYALSCRAFEGNFLYVPLSEREFTDQYRRLLPFVNPALVLMAERAGELVGLLFAVPDILSAPSGRATDTLVIKTVAVAPDMARAGIGSLLVATAQRRAARLGFRRAIHALMHERNISQHISRRYARTFRRYALFGRQLSPTSKGLRR